MSRFPSGVFLVLLAVLTAEAQPVARQDAFGDPLPGGAVARLGTTRLRARSSFVDIVFAPDGKSVATATARREVSLWDAKDGRRLRCFNKDDYYGMTPNLAFSPDGAVLAAALGDNVRLWATATGQLIRTIENRERTVYYSAVTFTPDGKYLLTADRHGPVELRKVSSGEVVRTYGDVLACCNSLAVSPDGRHLAVGFGHEPGERGDVGPRLFDLHTARELRRFAGCAYSTSHLSFSPCGRRLATGDPHGVRVWEVVSGQQMLHLRQGLPSCAAFAPDGRTIAVAHGNNRVVDLYETATGRHLQRLPTGGRRCNRLAFAPDGKTLATACDCDGPGLLNLWDLGDFRQRAVRPGHDASVWSLALSADGTTLASGDAEGRLLLWQLKAGRCLGQLDLPQRLFDPYRYQAVAFSPDGRTLHVRGKSAQFTWDLAAGQRLQETPLPKGGWGIHAYAPDGSWGAVADMNGPTVTLWARDSAKPPHILRVREHYGSLASGTRLAFSADGTLLATSSGVFNKFNGPGVPPSETIYLWDVKSGRLLNKFRPANDCPAVSFSHDNTHLAVLGGGTAPATIWDVKTGRLLRTLEAPPQRTENGSSFTTLAFSPQGEFLLFADFLGHLALYSTASGKRLHYWRAHDDMVTASLFSPDGRTLITGCRDTTILVWNVADLLPRAAQSVLAPAPEKSPFKGAIPERLGGLKRDMARMGMFAGGAERELLVLPGHIAEVTTVSFSPDGRQVLSGGLDGLLRLSDVRTGRLVLLLDAGQEEKTGWLPKAVLAARFSPEGTRIVAANSSGDIRLWETPSGKLLWQQTAHKPATADVAFSPDGKSLASVGFDGQLRLWETTTGRPLRSWKTHRWRSTAVVFARDGKTLYTGGVVQNTLSELPIFEADEVRTWDAATGKELAKPGGKAHRLSLTPDGSALVRSAVLVCDPRDSAAAQSKTAWWAVYTRTAIGLRDLAGDKDRLTLPGQGQAADLSPDGRRLATATGSHLVLLSAGEKGNYQYPNDREEQTMIHDADGRVLLKLPQWEATALAFSPDGQMLVTGEAFGGVRLWDVTAERSVPAPRARQRFAPAELARLWDDLGGKDAAQALRAIGTLAQAGDDVVSVLSERVQPRGAAFEARVTKLLADLDAQSFRTRQQAVRALESLGVLAETAIRTALTRSPSLEMRKRLEEVLARLDTTPDAETLRTLRAVEVLEVVGSVEARRILERVATGSPLALEPLAAKAALHRLHAERAR